MKNTNKTRNEKRENTTNTTKAQRIVRNYEQLPANKWENLRTMDRFFGMYNLTGLKQENAESLQNLNK